MSQRDDVVPIRHMLEHAKEALSLVSGPPLVAALERVLADLG
jgi:hypothetical protein